ncbi:TetR/AcrR family transcriptional regulator [Simiduia sp. 21SJ11W-1]|uniref:TetR/AcrR family transcriptional regulator n=1 Tax=Simiduia sp. 21SJ11W-1 TaxID=2909669 RepID=UPI0020A21254|nr:TetR/AcrR family transcriptional regulator [Simiduia sp. 21SJ11W-1]UTA48776.1 TetR/AcrR family transcriptional regulator [Simiduia sp. 21SJ11W-1]
MKKATRGRSEEKRQQIIAAASHLFTEQGYLSTSMDQVAEAAGVSKQTVYSHFGTKDDLFRFCVEDRCIANAMHEGVFNDDAPLREVLIHFAQHFQELIQSREAIQLCRLCATNAELHPEISQMFFAAGPARVEETLQGFLARKTQQGQLECDNIAMAAEQLLSLFKTHDHFKAMIGLPTENSAEQLQHYLERSVDMFLGFYGNTQ